MEPWELVARESVRDLVARYNANGDSGRFDPLLELFAEDAVMELPNGRHEGKPAIRAMFTSVAEGTGEGGEAMAEARQAGYEAAARLAESQRRRLSLGRLQRLRPAREEPRQGRGSRRPPASDNE